MTFKDPRPPKSQTSQQMIQFNQATHGRKVKVQDPNALKNETVTSKFCVELWISLFEGGQRSKY